MTEVYGRPTSSNFAKKGWTEALWLRSRPTSNLVQPLPSRAGARRPCGWARERRGAGPPGCARAGRLVEVGRLDVKKSR